MSEDNGDGVGQADVKDRLTVVETVYYQSFDANPQSIESRYSRFLNTHEQPYERRLSVGEEWEPLQTGWVDKVGMMVIKNLEGRFLHRQPTEYQEAQAARKVLEIGYISPVILPISGGTDFVQDVPNPNRVWLIPPKESMRAIPTDISQLMVRSRRDTIKFLLFLIPE